MATNELAAILARRRAKDGSKEAHSVLSKEEAPKVAIEQKITLKNARVKEPKSSTSDTALNNFESGAKTDENTSSFKEESNEGAAGNRIRQIKQNLAGIAINPFRPGAPPARKFGGESIMKTGEEFARNHAMGIQLPGMGAAIPMPGMAKIGMRLPGMAQEKEETGDVAHATLTRASGPKRRAPTSRIPGATALPGMNKPVEQTQENTDDSIRSESIEGPSAISVEEPSALSVEEPKLYEPQAVLVTPEEQSSLLYSSASFHEASVPTLVPENSIQSSTPLYTEDEALFSMPIAHAKPPITPSIKTTTSDSNVPVPPKSKSSSNLFANASDDEDSDWSDDEETSTTLFTQTPHPTSSSKPTASIKQVSTVQSSVPIPSPSLFGHQTSDSEDENLIEDPQIATTSPPSSPIDYQSLNLINSDISDESPDEDGLFGTGFPCK